MIIIVSPSRPNCPRPDDFFAFWLSLSHTRLSHRIYLRHRHPYSSSRQSGFVPFAWHLCCFRHFSWMIQRKNGMQMPRSEYACVRACCCIMFVFSCIIKTRSKRKKPTVLNIMHEAVNACVHLCVWVWLFCLLCCASSEATKPHCSR